MTLDKYYRYWDEFVCEWKNFMSGGGNIASWCRYTHLSQWLYPSFCNYIDKNNSSTPTIDYLPEPWWGNNGKHPLSAVVINLNPGKGGTSQHYTSLANIAYSAHVSQKVDDFVNNKEYKVYINNKYVTSTTEWLLTQRALPIFNAFPCLKVNNKANNVLGVDLIPWHSEKSATVTNYIKNNYNAIYNYSIKLALKASESIQFKLLCNVVFARVKYSTIDDILTKNNVKHKTILTHNSCIVCEITENNRTYHLISVTSFHNNMPSRSNIQETVLKLYLIKSTMNSPDVNSTIDPKRCQYVGDFASCGLAPVMIDNKYGYVDKDYKVIIPFIYDDAFGFQSNGLAKVRIFLDEDTACCGIINEKGKVIIPIKYSAIDTFKNGVAKAYIFDGDDEKVLYFDEKGNIINK